MLDKVKYSEYQNGSEREMLACMLETDWLTPLGSYLTYLPGNQCYQILDRNKSLDILRA
jgi:hypothetical protein